MIGEGHLGGDRGAGREGTDLREQKIDLAKVAIVGGNLAAVFLLFFKTVPRAVAN